MTRAIDSHCHLNFKAFEHDWKEVLEDSLRAGVDMIVVGTDLKTSQKAVEIAKHYSGVYAAVGFHPIHVIDRDWRSEILEIATLVDHPKAAAVGEVGFDRYRMPRENLKDIEATQERVFDFLVGEAVKVKKPLIIHNREAMDLFLPKLPELEKSKIKGVVHCYPGNLTQAKKLFDAGFKIGFTGLITYNNQWDELIKKIPLENILIETDSPYLTPVPCKGSRNEPKNVLLVAQKIAGLKLIPIEDVISATSQTARSLFDLKL